jgi:hypothetical protein
MKDLIRKVLQEEISKKFTKGNVEKENFIKKHMEKIISNTTRVAPPPDENYGNYNEEWCNGSKIVMEAKYYFGGDDNELTGESDDKFFAGDLYVDKEIIDFLSKMLLVRKSFILNVITEWYDDKYTTKFGQETGHPEFEIDETHEMDDWRKCYQIIDTDNLSRDEMIDYIDKHTAHNTSLVKRMSDDELSKTYRRVYRIQSNK